MVRGYNNIKKRCIKHLLGQQYNGCLGCKRASVNDALPDQSKRCYKDITNDFYGNTTVNSKQSTPSFSSLEKLPDRINTITST